MASAITRQNDDLPKEDPETIFARANLALARSQRLVASWLPSPTADELANEPSEEELQKQEEDIFVAVPEKLGLGARIPSLSTGTLPNSESLGFASDEKLRRQLLGRKYRVSTSIMNGKGNAVGGTSSVQVSRLTRGIKGGLAREKDRKMPKSGRDSGSVQEDRDEEEDDDDDEGRSSIIGRERLRLDGKKGRSGKPEPIQDDVPDGVQANEELSQANEAVQQSKRQQKTLASKSKKRLGGSYLDELLADRSKKKKKGH